MTLPRTRQPRRLTAALAALGLLAWVGLAAPASAADPSPVADPGAAETSGAPVGSPSSDPTPGDPTPSDPGSTDPSPGESPSSSPSAEPSPSNPPAPSAAPRASSTCTTCPPGSYVPRAGTLFNYPYSNETERYRIRTHVYGAVKSVPWGGAIRLALYSLNDDKLVNALIEARKRHVSVQVVVNEHNVHGVKGQASSPPFKRLMATFGSRTGARGGIGWDRVSWAKYCNNSCRGRGGNVHYKMMLFSSAGGRDGKAEKNITMMGSPNLTMLAANGQWNHLQTYVDATADAPMYSTYSHMFREMGYDSQAHPMYRNYCSAEGPANVAGCTPDSVYCGSSGSDFGHLCAGRKIAIPTYFFPKPDTHTSTDPVMQALSTVGCTGVKSGYGKGGRTLIRIGMYAWYENRGLWLAKRVRQLWNAGCDVAVETAIMGNSVKSVLYSPSGRGRIPIRQVGTYAKDGTVLTYDHAKYVIISGHQMGDTGRVRTITGTTNFSDLGFYSDDSVQTYTSWGQFSPYYSNFRRVWSGPHAFTPSPTGGIKGDVQGRYMQFGQGKYARMTAD